MAKFQYTLSEDDNEDRIYARVDDVFDISILRVEAGIAIDENSLARNREV
jgi:hypothetical protein